MIELLKYAISTFLFAMALCSCTAALLEARLEADPQCKPIINPKTGSLMPCPGTNKEFYKSVGLIAAKGDIKPSLLEASKVQDISIQNITVPTQNQSSLGCKPQLHKKTGTVLPCPAD